MDQYGRGIMALDHDKLVLVMVGLPGRGKSFIARKIEQYYSWFDGRQTKAFNVGRYRRMVEDPATSGKVLPC
jgi:adenylylsulfate kinase-like enzyme